MLHVTITLFVSIVGYFVASDAGVSATAHTNDEDHYGAVQQYAAAAQSDIHPVNKRHYYRQAEVGFCFPFHILVIIYSTRSVAAM
jgi:hypothetical protein